MYFLVSGEAGFVLPRYLNKVYITIEKGKHFGHIDLFGERPINEPLIQTKSRSKYTLLRQFTVQALKNCDLLTLSVNDLDKMRIEFPDIYH